jgi:hypothetical protein
LMGVALLPVQGSEAGAGARGRVPASRWPTAAATGWCAPVARGALRGRRRRIQPSGRCGFASTPARVMASRRKAAQPATWCSARPCKTMAP